MKALITINEICRLLTHDRLSWLVNQEQNKPLPDYFTPRLQEILTAEIHTLNAELEVDLFATRSQYRDCKATEQLATDILKYLYIGTIHNGMSVSILKTFRLISADFSAHTANVGKIYRNDPRPNIRQLLSTADTLMLLKNALYTWSATLIGHIREFTPELFDAYRLQFRENIDLPILNIEDTLQTTPVTSPPATNVTKLSHPQIAILHHYKKICITKNNAPEIARQYGQTSGPKLFETYKGLTSELMRTGEGRNKVKDIEIVSELLNGEYKILAIKELLTAKANKLSRQKK